MDQIVTQAMMMARGAAAFDKGLGIDDHDMNHGAAAIHLWQAGWRARRAQANRRFAPLIKVSPP